jgi:hypothetical protein
LVLLLEKPWLAAIKWRRSSACGLPITGFRAAASPKVTPPEAPSFLLEILFLRLYGLLIVNPYTVLSIVRAVRI